MQAERTLTQSPNANESDTLLASGSWFECAEILSALQHNIQKMLPMIETHTKSIDEGNFDCSISGHGVLLDEFTNGVVFNVGRLQAIVAANVGVFATDAQRELLAETQRLSVENNRVVEQRLQKRLDEMTAKRVELERYIMTLCHELRTPVNSVVAWTEIMMHRVEHAPKWVESPEEMNAALFALKPKLPEEALKLTESIFVDGSVGSPHAFKDILAKVHASAELQLAICNDILDYWRAQSGFGMELQLSDFFLEPLLREALDLVQTGINGRETASFTASISISSSELRTTGVRGDRRRLLTILLGLLTNAFKATMEGSVDILAWVDSNQKVHVQVKDTGVGMDAATVESHMSRPFVAGSPFATRDPSIVTNGHSYNQACSTRHRRNQDSVNDKRLATGLGFGIVKHVVKEVLGGELLVDSKVGEGTRIEVVLSLPMVDMNSTFDLNPSRSPQNSDEYERPNGSPSVIEDCSRSSALFTTPVAQNNAVQLKILVADDVEANREALAGCLKTLGQHAHIDMARDGDEALQKINDMWSRFRTTFDLVLCDVQMPKLCGDDMTEQLRQCEVDECRPRTLVVGISAHAVDDVKEQCLRKGMDRYETKPVFLRVVQSILQFTTDKLDNAAFTVPNGAPMWKDRLTSSSNEIKAFMVLSKPQFLRQRQLKHLKLPNSIVSPSPIPLPDDFALVDHNVCDLKDAWEKGVPIRNIYIEFVRSVVAIDPTNFTRDLRKMNETSHKDLYNDVHRIGGDIAYLYAHPTHQALHRVETILQKPFPSIESIELNSAVDVLEEKLTVLHRELQKIDLSK